MAQSARNPRRWAWLGWIAATGGYLGLLAAGMPGTASAPMAVIAVSTTAVLGAAPYGALAAASVVLIDGWVRGWDSDLAFLALALAAALVLTDRVMAEVRRSQERARASGRLLSLTVSALRVVAQADRERDAAATLPGLLQRDVGSDVRVWRTSVGAPEVVAGGGSDEAADAIAGEAVGRVLQKRTVLYEKHRSRMGARYLAAFPVFERGDVASVITAVRRHPFDDFERRTLEEFAVALGGVLTTLHGRRDGELVLDLLRRTVDARHLEVQARAVAEVLTRELGVDGAVVLRYAAGRFIGIAAHGVLTPGLRQRIQDGIPFGGGVVWEVYADGEARFIEDYAAHPSRITELVAHGVRALAVLPVSGGPRCHFMLALVSGTPRLWRAQDKALLTSVAVVLRGLLAQHDSEHTLAEMLRLERELLATPAAEMYPRLLEAAVRLVPGAEAGSLLVRGLDGVYAYAAVAGYDLEALDEVRIPREEMLLWYGQPEASWRRGMPRVLRSAPHRSVADVSAHSASDDRIRRGGRTGEIEANLCLPVHAQGEVLAVLNLDALHDRDAFGEAAVEAARAFEPLIGFLLHEGDVRRRLAEAARTDALTGLPNRRAFNDRVQDEFARAGRYGHALAVLVMDLRGFKRVNDTLGHAKGDEALVLVARALQQAARASDHVYRLGGDEFAALLPHAGPAEAGAVAGRIAERVAGLRVGDRALAINVGVANFPHDGRDVDTLLRLADDRMYRAKAGGYAVEAPEG